MVRSALYTCIVLIIIECTSVYGWKNFDTMRWNKGDRIGCLLHGFAGALGYKHWMLGENDSTLVIHMEGDKGDGYIRSVHYKDFNGNIMDRRYCVNEGQGTYGESAVDRARSMLNEKRYYDKLGCNCWDYVNYWANGGGLC